MNLLSNCPGLSIRKAVTEQINDILALFNDCRAAMMEEEDIFQWPAACPSHHDITADIQNGNIWCLQQDDECVGTIHISDSGAAQYKAVTWLDIKGKVLFIQRLAVHPTKQKQGYARQLMDFAEEHARSSGYTSIRLDAYSGHSRVFRLYEQRSFKRRGSVYFPGRSMPFYCYEKMIS